MYASSSIEYKKEAHKLNLAQERYWQILLHIVDGESEIDDEKFFLSPDGKTDAKSELDATLEALLNETRFDDNSTACRFPARKAWLAEKLSIDNLPKVKCKEYDKIVKRLNPKSATLVFPTAHINSPASMFGHTFIRINSAYNSKLLSYAINYAAGADPDKENGVVFAIKGLVGGYYGNYSLLPYYEKLKEYRDTEQRDIWEYDLNLNEDEVQRMVRHIWELNNTNSYYYFFTQNCSYNMLWLIESARESIHLREYFTYQVLPLETIHAAKEEGIISSVSYRPSKRTKLLKYEKLLDEKYIEIPKALVNKEISPKEVIDNKTINMEQKRYILESAIEYLEYSYAKNNMEKEEFISLFHNLTKLRATLGIGKKLSIEKPNDPIDAHKAIRSSFGTGYRDNKPIVFVGIRPAYHDLEDSNYGFLRGTQIEFLDLELSYSEDSLELEKLTLLSIVSLSQISEFVNTFSWKMRLGFDRNSLDDKTKFMGSIGGGFSFGNDFAFSYFMVEPLFYIGDKPNIALGGTVGVVVDKYDYMSTNIELTHRLYYDAKEQSIINISQAFRLSQNTQIKLKYNYITKDILDINHQETYNMMFNYYF